MAIAEDKPISMKIIEPLKQEQLRKREPTALIKHQTAIYQAAKERIDRAMSNFD